MPPKMNKVRAGDLVEDESVLVRTEVFSDHVADLAKVLLSGSWHGWRDPIVVERGSNRIVDGWHRVRAHKRVDGPDAVVEVEYREYPNDGDRSFKRDAASLNAQHGLKLDRDSKIKCARMLLETGLDMAAAGQIMGIRGKDVEIISARVVLVPPTTKPGPRPVFEYVPPERVQDPPYEAVPTAKMVARHLLGKPVTAEQADAIKSAPGTSLLIQVRQLRKEIRADLVDREDPDLIAELGGLLVDLTSLLSVI